MKRLLLFCCFSLFAFAAQAQFPLMRVINNTGCDMIVMADFQDAGHSGCGVLTLNPLFAGAGSNILYTDVDLNNIGYQQEPPGYALTGVISVNRMIANWALATCSRGAQAGPCIGSNTVPYSSGCGSCSTAPVLNYSFAGGIFILTIN